MPAVKKKGEGRETQGVQAPINQKRKIQTREKGCKLIIKAREGGGTDGDITHTGDWKREGEDKGRAISRQKKGQI